MSGSNGNGVERTPPMSLDAETAVLGGMMIDRVAVVAVLEVLDDGMFYRDANRRVYRSIIRLFERGEAIDVLTLASDLKNTAELEHVGGYDYLSGLIDAVPTAANIEHHARIVRETSALRSLIEAASATIRDCYDVGGRTAREVLASAESRILAIDHAGSTSSIVRVKERLWPVFEAIERRGESGVEVAGIRTGLADLDREMLGLHAGQLTVVAGRPSMGKTALGMTFALSAAIEQTIPTAFFSFEMTADELTERALAVEGRVDLQSLKKGRLSQEEHERMAAAAGHVNVAPLFIDDSDDVHVQTVAAKIRRLRVSEKIGLVLIDYLQLMDGDGENRREEIDSITRRLKLLAKSLAIPIVLLSQLSRGPETRTSKRPMMSDLRESGGIEQDADNVVLLYRPEYYMSAEEMAKSKDASRLRGLTELIIAKQRNGPTGTVKVHFAKPSTRFENLARGSGSLETETSR